MRNNEMGVYYVTGSAFESGIHRDLNALTITVET